MDWKTWTKISGVILFIIAVTGFYLSNFHKQGVELSIQNFPENLDSLDTEQDISFSFFIYNQGDTTAFVDAIILVREYADGSQVADTATISPEKDFTLEPGESKEISITLPPEEKEYTLSAEIFYEEQKISSEKIPVVWGTLL
jgi:hypothetical protein